jgi:protein required for attachment to host cells
MTVTWILITNGTYAKLLFAHNDAQEIRLIREFLHPRTAKKDFDTMVDQVGEFHKDTPLKPAIDYSPNMEAYERLVFAKEQASFLEKAHDLNEFDKLIVVASREMLGELRKAFAKPLKNVVEHELAKDLLSMNYSNIELLEKIRNDLGLLHY